MTVARQPPFSACPPPGPGTNRHSPPSSPKIPDGEGGCGGCGSGSPRAPARRSPSAGRQHRPAHPPRIAPSRHTHTAAGCHGASGTGGPYGSSPPVLGRKGTVLPGWMQGGKVRRFPKSPSRVSGMQPCVDAGHHRPHQGFVEKVQFVKITVLEKREGKATDVLGVLWEARAVWCRWGGMQSVRVKKAVQKTVQKNPRSLCGGRLGGKGASSWQQARAALRFTHS